jgi:hypothetical protein
MNATASVGLALSTLSGVIRGVLETPFGDVGEKLFAWDGIPLIAITDTKTWTIPLTKVFGDL